MSSLWTPDGEQPVGQAPSREEQELAEQLATMQEELARTPAAVVIANHAVGLFQLAAIHLNHRPPNLEEGRLAIDALAALLDGLQGQLGDEEEALRDALSQVRLAFVSLSKAAAEA